MSNETRTAVVTGGTSGIGRAVAESLVRSGVRVVVASRGQERCARAEASLRSMGGTAIGVPTDVADPAAVRGLVETAQERYGSVDILVAAGGSDPFWSPAEIGETPDAPKALDVVTNPKISGTAKPGKVLKAVHGTFKPAATSYGYQWTRDGKAVAGARKATYRVTAKDKGHVIGLVEAKAT